LYGGYAQDIYDFRPRLRFLLTKVWVILLTGAKVEMLKVARCPWTVVLSELL
jgi:hypothetical protein